MSRILLCVALVVAMFAFAAADDTKSTITVSAFSGDNAKTCQGTNYTSTIATAGDCSKVNDYTWMAYFCDTSYVYAVQYDDRNCTTARATGITAMPTKCGFQSQSTLYTCQNPSAGPALPGALSFPPSGWATSQSCMNATASPYSPATTCSAGSDANIHCTQSAHPAGFCKKDDDGLYAAGYCTADGQYAGEAVFSDSACSTAVLRVELTSTGCNNGQQISCPSNAAVFPSLPSKGFTSFDNDACTLNPNSAPYVTLFGDNCVESQKFSCGAMVNGTQSATLSNFDATDGSCPAGKNTDTTQLVGQCKNGMIFTCSYGPSPSGNSAAAASTSVVALFVAALLALVAGRQL